MYIGPIVDMTSEKGVYFKCLQKKKNIQTPLFLLYTQSSSSHTIHHLPRLVRFPPVRQHQHTEQQPIDNTTFAPPSLRMRTEPGLTPCTAVPRPARERLARVLAQFQPIRIRPPHLLTYLAPLLTNSANDR